MSRGASWNRWVATNIHLDHNTRNQKLLIKYDTSYTERKGKMNMDLGLTSNFNLVSMENKEVFTAQRLDMENIRCPRQSF
jgi:hypothetical protein